MSWRGVAIFGLLFVIVAISNEPATAAERDLPEGSIKPPEIEFVPDEVTAISIAEAVLIPIYGAANIERQRPFTAVLSDGAWTVQGYLPENFMGGVATVKLSKPTFPR